MDGSRLQQLVYKGYGKAAFRIGSSFTVYRSTTGIEPINAGNVQGNVLASANINWEYTKANKYGNAVWQLVTDGRAIQRFDYLVGDQTFFIAGMQHLLPILGVECNARLTFKRPAALTGKGYVGYSGNTAPEETTLMQACPVSLLENSKGEQNPVGLPQDTKMPWFKCLAPYLGNVTLKTGDVAIDEQGARYIVSSDELTDLGWRLTLSKVGA